MKPTRFVMSTNIKRMRITLKIFRVDTMDKQNQKNSGEKSKQKESRALDKVEFRQRKQVNKLG